jgi:hypothetical protein
MILGETAGAGRGRSKDAYARFTGTAPIPVWSGERRGKVRLNRGGNRTVNTALHMIAVTQVRGLGPGQAYVERLMARGKTRTEAVRLLRRRLSDVVFTALRADEQARHPDHGPVRVWVRTVVVMSGTARRWTVAFWSPITAASNAIITYRRAPPPPTGGPSARTPATATGRSSSSSVTVSQRRRTGAATWAPAGPTMLLASRPPAVAPTRNTASDTLGASTGNPCAPAAPKASSTTLPVMLAVKT